MSHGHCGPALGFRPSVTIGAEKTAFRAVALARRAATQPAARQAFAIHLAQAGLALVGAAANAARTVVSVYHPIRGEADTGPLLEVLAEAGFATALPFMLEREKPLRFHLWRPGDPVAAGRWNILEPLPTAPVVDPDVLFVPLAAFDRQGFRLGYGAGFYDNALFALRRAKPVLAVGVAFAVQEVERVPREPHDQRLDAVITEVETLVLGRG